MANQDTSAALLGSGSVSVIEASQVTYSVDFSGTGEMTATVESYVNVAAVNFDGSLNGAVQSGNYINTYASLYGFLTSTVNAEATCENLLLNMEPPEIEVLQCSIEGELVDLQVFKNNTLPVTARLSVKGNYNIVGHTIRLSVQLAGDTLYTVTGTITDGLTGAVSFALNPLSVDTAGVGEYDIEGHDGTYVYTYGKGTFTVLENLTVPV